MNKPADPTESPSPAPFLVDPPSHPLGCDCETCNQLRNNDSVGRLLDTISTVFLRGGRR
jgi:hypothetical protein